MTDIDERFERQVADVATRAVGPERHVDALAVARGAMAPRPRRLTWGPLRTLATVVGTFALALFGGVVFLGLLDADTDQQPAVSPSPTASFEPLPDFDLGASVPIADDRRRFTSAARLPTGELVVVGVARRMDGSPGLATAWTSHDDGATWTESSLTLDTTGEATEVIATDEGFVAIVRTDARASRVESVVWVSPDGLAWEDLAILPDALLTDVLAVPDGLAAIGVELREAEGHDEPAAYPSIWTSADGRDWQVDEISEPWHEPGEQVLLAGDVEGHIADLPLDVARSDEGVWLVSGVDRVAPTGPDPVTASERPAVWIGSPGESWSRVTSPMAAPAEAGRFDVITWRPDGFVLTGEVRDDSGATSHGIWITPDGTMWERVLDAGMGAPLEVAAASDDLIVLIRPPVAWELPGAIYPAQTDAYREVTDDHPWAMRPDRLLDAAPILLSRDGRTWSSSSDPLTGFPLAATIDRDGSIIVVGADVSECDRWWCAYESNYGAVPTVWIDGSEATPEQGPMPSTGVEP